MDSNTIKSLQEAYNNVHESIVRGSGPSPSGSSTSDSPAAPAKPQLSQRAQAILSGNSPLSRDPRARGGFDPRFDKKPTSTTTSSAPKPTTPTTTTAPKPTGPVTQAPKPADGGGLLGSLDKFARDTAGKLGGTYGREKASKVPGANIPGLGDIIKGEGERRGRNKGQEMYDKAKETLGGLLKQEYQPDAFDIVLEYLVAEGYADTNKAALAIMANMSEEWRQSIIEQSNTLVTPEQRRADELKHGMNRTTPVPPPSTNAAKKQRRMPL